MSEVRELQKQIDTWAVHNFGEQESTNPLLGIVEEVGELCHAVLKRRQQIRMNEDHGAQERDAIADIFIYLCDYCNRRKIDLSVCIEEVWAKVKQRDWTKESTDDRP